MEAKSKIASLEATVEMCEGAIGDYEDTQTKQSEEILLATSAHFNEVGSCTDDLVELQVRRLSTRFEQSQAVLSHPMVAVGMAAERIYVLAVMAVAVWTVMAMAM